jgi:hypothetical protein
MNGHKLVAATALACIGAAGVGGYVAVRTGSTSSEAASVEAAVGASSAQPASLAPIAAPPETRPGVAKRNIDTVASTSTPVSESSPSPVPSSTPALPQGPQPEPALPSSATVAETAPVEVAATTPLIEELEVPEGAVVGVRLENGVSSETAAIEDRVVGRVTRAVTVGNRTVIPAGAEVIGHVSAVERGGKVKGSARVGITFTTIVLNRVRTPFLTETIYRVGETPTREAATKIGGGAAIGTIIGGMIGGKKGAAIGGTAGAAGGTAVVMRGDRNEAVFDAGASATVRLAAPVKVRVER